MWLNGDMQATRPQEATMVGPVVEGTAGRFYVVENGKVTDGPMSEASAFEAAYGPEEGPSCSICDGLGHGYPGGRPCPLEERGGYEPEERF